MEVLTFGGARIKIEADSDASFFGNSNGNNYQLSLEVGDGGDMDMEVKDYLDETLFQAEKELADLDFTLLEDLTFPSEFNMEDLCMHDDSHSNSNSFTSEIYMDPSSSSSPFSDSPPLTPPSQTDSDGSAPSPSPSQILNKLRKEPNNNILLSTVGKQVIPIPLLKSSRGRSASHDSPDVQALKRHIRMIRNRESACLSRKKKKDHVTNLETRVAELECEIVQLKQENALLKSRVSGQQESIQSMTSKMYSNGVTSTKSKSNIPKTSPVVKIALLGLCCFVFVSLRPPSQYNSNGATNSLTYNSNSNYTSKIMLNSDIPPNSFVKLEEVANPNSNPPQNLLRSRRSFGLWEVNNTVEIEDQNLKNSSNENPKYNIQNMTKNINVNMSKEFRDHFHNSRSYRNLTFTNSPPVNKCPTPFNRTEALRVQNDLKGIFGKRVVKEKVPSRPLVYSLIDLELQNIGNKGLTIYNEKMRRFSSVLDQLQQRDDTFYVVSLSFENQLLLSAKAHNTTTRPKMSFVMPWKNDTLGGKEELMQIDCEVTRVVNLNSRKSNRRKRN